MHHTDAAGSGRRMAASRRLWSPTLPREVIARSTAARRPCEWRELRDTIQERGSDRASCHRQVSSQNRTRHGRFGKDAWLALRQKQSPNVRAQGSILPRFSNGVATPASAIDALKAAVGLPPGTRASFAWGRCVRGTYAPSDQAREITKSRSFTKPSRVLARFSLYGGNSTAANANGLLRGFSFRLGSDGQRSEIFTQSAPIHFARTLDQMQAFLAARNPGPDGRPDWEKVEAFSASNPETLHQADYIAAHPLPASFAGTTYWGVHAFPATNSKGETRFIKFKVMPVGEEGRQAANEATAKPHDLLHDLDSRIAARDIRFSVMALLDRPGDPVMDVTIRWPDEDARDALRLGTIVVTGVEASDACDEGVFNPANLAEGIGLPPDEIFAARRAAYAISQTRRR
jgi:catalase